MNRFTQAGALLFILVLTLTVSGIILFAFYIPVFPDNYRYIINAPDDNPLYYLLRSIHHFAASLTVCAVVAHLVYVLVAKRARAKGMWLTWVSAVGLALFFSAQGITGLILPMDMVARSILQVFLDIIPGETARNAFAVNDAVPVGSTVVLLALHIVPVFVAGTALLLHFHRINMPRLWPSKGTSAGITIGLFLTAIFFPLNLAPIADFSILTGKLPFYWQFMTPLLFVTVAGPAFTLLVLLIGIAIAIYFIKSLGERFAVKPVELNLEKCVGCALCEADCPYGALSMTPAPLENHHPWLVELDEDLCAGCPVCVGSCGFGALSAPDRGITAINEETSAFLARATDPVIVYACKESYPSQKFPGDKSTLVVPLICAGQLPANQVALDYKRGAKAVIILSCKESACKSRLGSMFTRMRMFHLRKPWLRDKYRSGPLKLIADGGGTTDEIEQKIASVRKEFSNEPGDREYVSSETAWPVKTVSAALVTFVLILLFQWASDSYKVALIDKNRSQLVVTGEVFAETAITVKLGGTLLLNEKIAPDTPLGGSVFHKAFDIEPGQKETTIEVSTALSEKTVTLSMDHFLTGRVHTVIYDPRTNELNAAP